MSDPWPLRHLVLRTPRLTLRPDDDEGLHKLAALGCAVCTHPTRCRSNILGPPSRRTIWCAVPCSTTGQCAPG